jgi:protein AATF/BFR2
LILALFYARYEAHEKLQNFMVPVVGGGWHEEQIDELFSSLLGKGFENSMVDLNYEEHEEQVDEALKTGFRVFG